MKKYLAALLAFTILPFASYFNVNADQGNLEGYPEIPPLAEESGFQPAEASWTKNRQEPVSLDWFIAFDWYSGTFNPDVNLFDKDLRDATGITLNVSSGNVEKLNTLIASDSLPDIVTCRVRSAERLNMENNGLLAPLNELRDQYAPDFKPVPSMEEWYKNKDGNWYVFASYYFDLDNVKERNGILPSHIMNFARFDIMNQLGITAEDMQTKDGFVDALKKVKEANLDYNGTPIIPFMGNDVDALAEQFGLDREDENGDYLEPIKQKEYLEALLFLNRLYREGLMTEEVFTSDRNLVDQIVSSGQLFAGMPAYYVGKRGALWTIDKEALMGGIGLLKGDEGKTDYTLTPLPTGGWTATAISNNCKHKDRAIQLFSYMSQPDASLSFNGGAGWQGYEIKDHKMVIKDERKEELKKDPDGFALKYQGTGMDFFADQVYSSSYPSTDTDEFKEDTDKYYREWQENHLFDDKIFSDVQPDPGTDMAILAKKIEDYYAPVKSQIILASSEEEAIQLYEQAIAEMDAIGFEELIKFKNEKFHQNKERFGLKYAWPKNQKKFETKQNESENTTPESSNSESISSEDTTDTQESSEQK